MEQNLISFPRFPTLPERIQGLEKLAYNLWWSWHRAAREMFPALDVQAWRESANNPLRMLARLQEETLQAAARSTDFRERYDAGRDEFDAKLGTQTGWFTSEHGKSNPPMAY